MDLSAAFLVCDESAAAVRDRSAMIPSAYGCLVAPIDGLPAENLRAWILDDVSTPFADRLQAALRLDQRIAWELLDARSPQQILDARSRLLLATWQARQLAAWSLSAQQQQTLALPARDEQLATAGRRAYHQLARIFAAHRPSWIGPVIFCRQAALLGSDAEPGAGYLRPVLPVLVITDEPCSNQELEDRCSAALIRFKLDRLRRGAADWPSWLVDGLLGVAAARTRGQGPSPRAMLRERQAAGIQAIRAVFDGSATADRALATALVAPFVHSRRVGRFASFLDLLRNGVPTSEAMALAYRLDLASYLDQP